MRHRVGKVEQIGRGEHQLRMFGAEIARNFLAYCDSSYTRSVKPIVKVFTFGVSERMSATTRLESMPPLKKAPTGTSLIRRYWMLDRSGLRAGRALRFLRPASFARPAANKRFPEYRRLQRLRARCQDGPYECCDRSTARRNVQHLEIKLQRVRVDFKRHIGECRKCLERRSEHQLVGEPCAVKRLDADAVAREI